MITEIKHLMIQVLTDVKTILALSFAGFSDWYIEHAASTISALTQILSFIILIVVLVFHIINYIKIKLETKNLTLEIELNEKKLQENSGKEG